MLAKLRCLRCGSPMYRKLIGGRLSRRYAYRCEGQGPQRKGCGNVVPYEQTEQIVVDRIFMTSTDPYEDRQWVSGWNYDAEIADLLKQLTALNPLAEDDEVRRPALIAQLREYQRKNEEEAITGGYERTWYLRENGRKGMQVRERSQHHDDELWTMGEEFDTLDRDQQREYLSTHHDIRVKRVLNPPLEPGASVGLHVVIDGADHGTFVFPPSPR